MGFYTYYDHDDEFLLSKKSFDLISKTLVKAGIPKKVAYNPVFLELLCEDCGNFSDVLLEFTDYAKFHDEDNDIERKKAFFNYYINLFKKIFEVTQENNKIIVSTQCLHKLPIDLSENSEFVSREFYYTLPGSFEPGTYHATVAGSSEKYFLPGKKEVLLYIKEYFENYKFGYTIENIYEGKDFIYNIEKNTYSLKKVTHAFAITNEEGTNNVIIESSVDKTVETYNQDNKMLQDATYSYFGETDLNGFKLDEANILREQEVTELNEDKRYVNYKKTANDGFEYTIDKLNVSYGRVTETEAEEVYEIKRFNEPLWKAIGDSVRNAEMEFAAKVFIKSLKRLP